MSFKQIRVLFTCSLASILLSQRMAQSAVSVLFSSLLNSSPRSGGINADLRTGLERHTDHLCSSSWSLELITGCRCQSSQSFTYKC